MTKFRTEILLTWLFALGLGGAASADERDHELCPRHTGKIVFTQLDGGDNYEVYLTELGGTPKNLTNDPRADFQPTLSPDGRRIAWSRVELDGITQNLWVMNLDGSDAHRLNLQRANVPRWSPDGRRITFTIPNDDFSAFDVGVMDADGDNVHVLTNNGVSLGGDWSPDGREIAMSSAQFNSAGALDLVVMRADGSHVRKILTLPSDDIFEPRYSPDGRHFTFYRDAGGVWLTSARGDNLRRLPFTTDEDLEPDWSPDGRWLTFLDATAESLQIFIIRADGEDRQPVSPNGLQQFTPDWGR